MIQRTCIILIIAIVFISCNKNKVFEKHHKFNNNTWAKTENITFKTTIENIDRTYDILIAVRHMSGYPFANVVIGLTIETPVGEKRMMQHDLIIRNTDNSFKGDGLGDIWDVEVAVFKKFQFKNTGMYKFIIENRMHLAEMPGIMAIGLVIKKSTD